MAPEGNVFNDTVNFYLATASGQKIPSQDTKETLNSIRHLAETFTGTVMFSRG